MLNKKSIPGIILWLLLSGVSVTLVTISGLYLYLSPKLPSVDTLRQVQLQTPLRIYSSDKMLIGEFGEQRRTPLTYEQIPPLYLKALLSAEDAEFFNHHGVSIKGMLRAASQLLKSGEIQSGGSTITQQLARDFFLSRDQKFTRKINEILLSLEIERHYSKEEILELFNNKMFFGKGAYGIQSAAMIYYGRDITQLTAAEYASIVGSLAAPSKLNPISNPKRSMARRNWILGRMYELGHLDKENYLLNVNSANTASFHGTIFEVDAPYVAEMARQEVMDKFGQSTYSEGFKVYTSVDSKLQFSAQQSLVNGLLAYDKRHGYRGPENSFEESVEPDYSDWQDLLQDIPTLSGLEPAVVIEVKNKSISTMFANGELAEINWEQGLSDVRSYINEDSRGPAYTSASFLKKGDVIRLQKNSDNQWIFSQVPTVESALVSVNPEDGAIKALVGGFDFKKSHYNHVTQGFRQPGSSFKPFIYTLALENGFTPASIINDAPIVLENTGSGKDWRPENDDGKFLGPIRLRQALYRSRNLVSIRLLQMIGIQAALDSFDRFGFNSKEFTRDLTMALGTHEATPLQMVTAYSAFANGGYKITPYLIDRIENSKGEVIYQAKPHKVCRVCEEPLPTPIYTENGVEMPPIPVNENQQDAPRVIDKRIAYLIDSMLKDVIKRGTGRQAWN